MTPQTRKLRNLQAPTPLPPWCKECLPRLGYDLRLPCFRLRLAGRVHVDRVCYPQSRRTRVRRSEGKPRKEVKEWQVGEKKRRQ